MFEPTLTLKGGSPMSFKRAFLLGLGLLSLGIYIVSTHKKVTKEFEKASLESKYSKWLNNDYLEDRYIFNFPGGILLINIGAYTTLLAFVRDDAGEVFGVWKRVFDWWINITIISIVPCGIIYMLWKFGIWKDKITKAWKRR